MEIQPDQDFGEEINIKVGKDESDRPEDSLHNLPLPLFAGKAI